MKILCVSDTVSKQLLEPVGGGPGINGVEMVLACGDLPPEYLTALRHRFDTPLYYVLGNHDLRHAASPPRGCRHIDRQLLKTGGLRLLGFSGSRWYNGNTNQYTNQQMNQFINRLRFRLWLHGGVDVVISHAPPRFIHDAEDPCHRGFRAFRWLIDKYRPRFFIHGHIHAQFHDDSERVTWVNSTRVINCYGYYLLEG
jgi:uncharacterized protein